ncbi:MAG: ROK family transcriptional regulator [Bifidobacteriaceae bacterium]|jgi:predicted NBD/HSP70 family sugar kinase|nr:ROK family transcriptional regulator [Bifidobacteriaceae bacterium]
MEPTKDGGAAPGSDQAVLEAVRAHGPLTRQDLVQLTGLSLATVNRAAARLTAGRLLAPAGHTGSTGGRPAETLGYNGASLAVAGLTIRERSATSLLMSLDGDVIGRHTVEFQLEGAADSHPAQRLNQALELFDAIAAGRPPGTDAAGQAPAAGQGPALGRAVAAGLAPAAEAGARPDTTGQGMPTPPVAIGVAIPGVVTPEGSAMAAHELGWERLALGPLLAGRTNIPVALENDANCLALGEHARGAGQGKDSLVALVLGSGLGAGLIVGGRLFRGFRHEAGEIGYLLTERESLRRHFPGRGDLESKIGFEPLTRRARELGIADGPAETSLASLIAGGLSAGGAPGEFARELLDLTAWGLASLCVVLDPELIILGGGHDAAESRILAAAIRDRLVGRILRVPEIAPPARGAVAQPVGAAAQAQASPPRAGGERFGHSVAAGLPWARIA